MERETLSKVPLCLVRVEFVLIYFVTVISETSECVRNQAEVSVFVVEFYVACWDHMSLH